MPLKRPDLQGKASEMRAVHPGGHEDETHLLKHTGTGLVFKLQRRNFNSSGIAGDHQLKKDDTNGKIISNEGLPHPGKMVTIDDSNLEGKESVPEPGDQNI